MFRKSLLFYDKNHNSIKDDIILNLNLLFSIRSDNLLPSFIGWKKPCYIDSENIHTIKDDIINSITLYEPRIEILYLDIKYCENVLDLYIKFNIKNHENDINIFNTNIFI